MIVHAARLLIVIALFALLSTNSHARIAAANDIAEGELTLPPSGLHESTSEHSLAWDTVLERAKRTALAPGTKALLVASVVCVCVSIITSCHQLYCFKYIPN